MAQSRLVGRPLAIILPLTLILPILLLMCCGSAFAQTVTFGFGGDGVFPKFATSNSQYWMRVVYDDGTSNANSTPPISYFRLESRPPSSTALNPSSYNLLPFLDESGLSQISGILPSPTASLLAAGSGNYTTTGTRPPFPGPGSTLMVASSVVRGRDYTGADIQITSGPYNGSSARVSAFNDFGGARNRNTNANGDGWGPLTTTALGTTTTLVGAPLPPGDWSDGRVRILDPVNPGNLNVVRDISVYNTTTNTITVSTAFPAVVGNGAEFRLEGPYTTTGGGTNLILLSTNLPGLDNQWVGGSVRITGPTGNALIGQAREIVAYDVTNGQIVVTNAFTAAVGAGVEFELDGFMVRDTGIGLPGFGESWEGAEITITEDPHPALNEVRRVVAYSNATGSFRVNQPFPSRIATATAYEAFLAIFTLNTAFGPPPVGDDGSGGVLITSFRVLAPGIGVPNWYLNGTDFLWSGVTAQGKIVIDAEDDADRDGDVDLVSIDNPVNVDPDEAWNTGWPGLNRPDLYLFMSSSGSNAPDLRYSIGPFTEAHGLRSGTPAHPGAARTHGFRFRVRYGPSPVTTIETGDATLRVCGSGIWNRDYLGWSGTTNLIDPDPLSIYDQPPWLVNTPTSGNSGSNTADDGTSSSIYTFQCIYRHPDGVPPRFNYSSTSLHSAIPAFQGTTENWGGHGSVPGNGNTINWLYSDSDDQWMYIVGDEESGVALIIDGDFTDPHFMIPISADGSPRDITSITEADYQSGVRFVYQILPTGYNPDVDIPSYRGVTGRPHYNAFVNFLPVNTATYPAFRGPGGLADGLHSYQFVCTDDFVPRGRTADFHVGRPSVRSFNRRYTPLWALNGSLVGPPVEDTVGDPNGRWNESVGVGTGGAWNYSIDSVDEGNPTPHPLDPFAQPTFGVRDNDPVLYAPLDNPRAPMLPPVAVADYPTNDGTISPNFYIDWPDLTPRADNRWLQSDTYTFFINYANSSNQPPLQIQMLLRREGSIGSGDVTTDPTTVSQIFPMQQVDPSDTDYRDGALYFCEMSPLNLQNPPGAASNTRVDDYQYFFRASDGQRSAWFPRRTERVDPVIGRTFPDDPFDFGVRVQDANNDYYHFRVNTPPMLANPNVTPSAQRPGLPFDFTVDYSDIDGAFRVNFGNTTGQQGDGPFRTDLNIDTFGDRDGLLVVDNIAGNVITYSRVDLKPVTYAGDGSVTDPGTGLDTSGIIDELYRRRPSTSSIQWRGREVKFESGALAGTDPILIDSNIGPGATGTITLASAPSGAGIGDTFSIVDWLTTTMTPAVPSDVNYTTPNQYEFSTGTIVTMTPGRLHEYFFEFADDHADWLFPDDVSQRREGEIVRLPQAGGFASPDNFGGPEVLVNRAPTLTNFSFSPDPTPTGPGNAARVGAGTPNDNADGNTATLFTLQFTYTDADNDAPNEIKLGLNGRAMLPNQILAVTQKDPSDTLFRDGKVYQAQIRLPVDLNGHVLRGRATDGLGGVFPTSRLGTATGGSATTVVDTTLGGFDDDWNAASLLITSGASSGQQRLVTDYVATTGTLSVGVPFAPGVSPGDTFSLTATYSNPTASNGPIVVPNTSPRLFFPATDEPDGLTPPETENPDFPAPSSGLSWPPGGFPPADHVLVGGDGTLGTATSNGAADGSTLVDSGLPAPANTWVGAQLLLTSGLSRGERRTVVSYTATTLTVGPPPFFSTQILAGTTYELALEQQSPGLEPDSGPSSANYVYRCIYFDADTFSPEQRGNPPEFVRLIIDSGQNQPSGFSVMAQTNSSDLDYTDGAEFSLSIPGGSPILAAGSPHDFFFEARDGLDTARLPGTVDEPGPIIDDPPAPPTGLTAIDVPGDQGAQIDLQWRKSADDGSGDVVRYSLRRQVSGAGNPISDPVAGAPFEIVSVLADGRDPYTFRDKVFDAVPRATSTTTAAGTATTVVDTSGALGAVDSFWSGATVTILSGPAITEVRQVTSYVAATGTLTVAPAFSAPIAAGVDFRVAVLDRLGQNPVDGRNVVATPYEYVVLAFDDVSDGSNSLSAASNTATATPDDDTAPAAPTGQACAAQPDGSINVTWNMSVDDPVSALPALSYPPVGDVIGYRVYRDEVPNIDPGNPQPTLVLLANETGTGIIPVVLGPGTVMLSDSSAVLGTQYYYLVRAVDRTQPSTNTGGTSGCIAVDSQPPYFDSFNPVNGAPAVPIDTTITFQVHDLGIGVDLATLTADVSFGATVENYINTSAGVAITQLVPGQDTDLEVVITRPSPFPVNTLVTVDLYAEDLNGNAPPGPTSFSFTTEQVQTIQGTIALVYDHDGNPGTPPVALPLAIDVTVNVTGPSGPLGPFTFTTSPATGQATYTIPAVTSGDYDITPVLAGATWDLPLPQTVNVPPTATPATIVVGPTFTGTVNTFMLSGTVTDHQTNPVQNATITSTTLDGTATLPALTDINGDYSIGPVLQGTYTVTPTLAGLTFSPVDRTVTAGTDPTSGLDFFALFSVSGHIERADTSADMQGVVVSVGGLQATTDVNGDYTITDVPAGSLTVTPSLASFTFAPPNQAIVLDITTTPGGLMSGIDFLGSPILYSISGTVSPAAAGGLIGLTITVAATGGPSTPAPVAVNPITGVYSITNLEGGTYTVTPSEAGGGAQFSPASRDITVPPSGTGVNFTGFRVFQVQSPGTGLQLLATPFTPMPTVPVTTVVDVFGTPFVARWNPQGIPAAYVRADVNPTHSVLRVQPGSGFFVSVPVGALPMIPGTPAPTDRNFAIPIYQEWTMSGNPFRGAFSWSSVLQSTSDISDLAWVYVNKGGAGYVLVTDTLAFNTRTRIEAYQGFWQRVRPGTIGASISIPAPFGVLSAGADEPEPEPSASPRSLVEGGWLLQLVASTEATRDACNYVGVGAPARGVLSSVKIDNPPAASDYADIYFDGAAQGEAGRRLATDIRSADAAELAFDFVVATDLVETDVTVSVPNLAQLARDRHVLLTDLDAGQSVFVRTKPSYTFNSGDGGERHFRLEVRSAAQTSLRITGLLAVPTRGASGVGAEIQYSLSAPALVTSEIYNVSGRLVARAEMATTRGSGAASTLWDGRSVAGTVVPNGLYTVRLTATGEQGEKTNAIATIPIRR